jgi:predicted nucleic acid-binding Zn ribbon protein
VEIVAAAQATQIVSFLFISLKPSQSSAVVVSKARVLIKNIPDQGQRLVDGPTPHSHFSDTCQPITFKERTKIRQEVTVAYLITTLVSVARLRVIRMVLAGIPPSILRLCCAYQGCDAPFGPRSSTLGERSHGEASWRP